MEAIVRQTGAFLAAALFVCSFVAAGEPKPFIDGPKSAIAGQLVTLDASKSEDCIHYKWKVISPTDVPGRRILELDSDGTKCRIATYPGKYTIQLLVANAEGIEGIFHELIVTDECHPEPGPQPPQPVPPGPQPPTPVDPVFPSGQFGISTDAYKWAMGVNSPARASEAQACGSAGDTLAAQIAAGTVKGDQQILNAIGTLFNNSTSANAAAWVSFRSQLSARVKELWAAGKIKSPTDWSALVREVSLALKAVK